MRALGVANCGLGVVGIAIEFGPTLPGFRADEGYGADLPMIVSQRWDWGTVHWNFQAQYTRDHHPDAFTGAIIEGPEKWKVRPVAEFFYEEEIGVSRTVSGLLGAIWQVTDDLAFDVAVRQHEFPRVPPVSPMV